MQYVRQCKQRGLRPLSPFNSYATAASLSAAASPVLNHSPPVEPFNTDVSRSSSPNRVEWPEWRADSRKTGRRTAINLDDSAMVGFRRASLPIPLRRSLVRLRRQIRSRSSWTLAGWSEDCRRV